MRDSDKIASRFFYDAPDPDLKRYSPKRKVLVDGLQAVDEAGDRIVYSGVDGRRESYVRVEVHPGREEPAEQLELSRESRGSASVLNANDASSKPLKQATRPYEGNVATSSCCLSERHRQK